MTKAMESKYAQRTSLNKECRLVMKTYGGHIRNRNIFLMTATHEDQDVDDNVFKGFINKVRVFI